MELPPIALAGDKPGQEIEHPMALIILGGLLTSTGLNLGVMPVLYGREKRTAPNPVQKRSCSRA
jgi:Cu/Ag efflux pump CusA